MASASGSDAKKVGAVLVIGGGIAGMQASLDLADSGLRVYLVENSPAIGGKMAQLDKTFPTNDCAMCTISPKLVECSRHLNIDMITNAQVMSLEGEAGNFTATVVRRPRYVDLEKCTACGECARVCPIKVPNSFNAEMGDRRAIYKLYPQAVPSGYGIDKKGRAPCKDACPISQAAQGYVALVREKRYDDAFRSIKDRNPFPGICGRICNHRCEDNCNRAQFDEAISIAGLKRFVADQYYAGRQDLPAAVERTKEETIAIVGAGPAGLTAAQDLAQMGYGVTVLEALPVAGGMMRVGVPSYRLPRQLIQREVDEIVSLGVDLQLNKRVENLDELFTQGFKAVFVAVGAHGGRKLPIPGADHPDVLINTTFLRDVALGNPPKLGEKVLVIGGGNVAMDCARAARRLGQPEVHLACLESRETMPAHDYEIADAEEEGITVHPARSFKAIEVKDGKIVGVRCDRVKSMSFDGDGRLNLETEPDSEHVLECDMVLFAIGQGPELEPFKEAGLEISRRRTLAVDPDTLATNKPGVFAGGDAVTGTTFVVDAIAAGHKAAISIDRFLKGEELKVAVEKPEVVKLSKEDAARKVESGLASGVSRHAVPKRPVAERFAGDAFGEVDLGFSEEMALAEANRCLACGICSECLECVRVCGPKAIDHDDRERIETLSVGAVVLATGFDVADPYLREEFGYGRYPNVVTALQLERFLSASGPTTGHVERPSDGVIPKRVAWLQCIGSRDQEHDYCSSVCCMYATKEAMLVKEHEPDTFCQVFMMDARAFSKGYTAYYERSKERYGVEFTRCRVSSLKEDPATKDVLITYEAEDGELKTERFGLVVLSVGMRVSPMAKALSERLGIDLNEHGFCKTAAFDPLQTSREGVYVCGAFAGPKDIPESVMQASGAAARAISLLPTELGTLARSKEFPAEKDVADEEARVGVFICHCGSNIAGVVDVKDVEEYVKTIPGVAYVERNLYTCAPDGLKNIREGVEEHKLNRVIVSSCTPRTHEPIFQETIREVGLNPYLFEMANIRDQCSWVHANRPADATEKAKALIRMAVGRARLLEPLHEVPQDLTHRALVIGGGVAGMTAALTIAAEGFEVYLVEKEAQLGGNLRKIHYTVDGSDPKALLESLVRDVENNPRITVFKESQLVSARGFIGNFKSVIATGPEGKADGKRQEQEVEHGVAVVATGGREYRGDQYLMGTDDRVMVQSELEERLALRPESFANVREVAMIQCVRPEDDSTKYCSRTCCLNAVKNAIKIKEVNPKASVYILYKDMMTFGFGERYYTEARRKGVTFVRFDESKEPDVQVVNGQLQIKVVDPVLREELTLRPDLLALSTIVLPAETNQELAETLRVPLSAEGFFLEAHVKLRPVDFASEGIYLSGVAHYPKFLEETIAQASASAARAATTLAKELLSVGGVVAQVNPDKCAACLTCVRVCPYNVPMINAEGVAQIEVAACQGCGTCAGECPAKAIDLMNYRDQQVIAKTDALFAEDAGEAREKEAVPA